MEKPWRLYVTIPYKNRPLPSQEELEDFKEVDWRILTLCEKLGARNVAVWTKNGVRDWILYAADPKDLKKMLEALFKPMGVQVEASLDPGWGQYKTLLAMVGAPPLEPPALKRP